MGLDDNDVIVDKELIRKLLYTDRSVYYEAVVFGQDLRDDLVRLNSKHRFSFSIIRPNGKPQVLIKYSGPSQEIYGLEYSDLFEVHYEFRGIPRTEVAVGEQWETMRHSGSCIVDVAAAGNTEDVVEPVVPSFTRCSKSVAGPSGETLCYCRCVRPCRRAAFLAGVVGGDDTSWVVEEMQAVHEESTG